MRKLDLSAGAINDTGGCWICGNRDGAHYHHIIPRAYGGTHGPQVRLCAVCHDGVHKVADQGLESARTVLPDVSGAALTCVKQLATIINKAKDVTGKDKNKAIVFSTRFNAATNRKLKQLVQATKQNQEAVVRLAIDELHRRLIGG